MEAPSMSNTVSTWTSSPAARIKCSCQHCCVLICTCHRLTAIFQYLQNISYHINITCFMIWLSYSEVEGTVLESQTRRISTFVSVKPIWMIVRRPQDNFQSRLCLKTWCFKGDRGTSPAVLAKTKNRFFSLKTWTFPNSNQVVREPNPYETTHIKWKNFSKEMLSF